MSPTTQQARVYDLLVRDLEQAILADVHAPGTQLPSEAELGRSYGISRISVRKALSELESRGLVFRRAGKGTFVQYPSANGRTPVLAPIGMSAPYMPSGAGSPLFLNPIHESVADHCFELGYRLEWVHVKAVSQVERDSLSGLICVSWPEEAIGGLAEIAERGVPVVMVNRSPKGMKLNSVTIDHCASARKAVEYLVQLGHRDVAMLVGDTSVSYMRERHQGYREALDSCGVGYDPELVIRCASWEPDEVWNQLRRCLSERKVTALFIVAGIYTAPALTTLHRLGRGVPQDVSVITFDDVPNPLYPIVPSLTAVRQPLAALGRRAVEMLHQAQRKGVQEPIAEVLTAELVVRDSCRAIS